MQYLYIDKNDSLLDISRIVGSNNIEYLLAENRLTRTPKIGKAWQDKCNEIINTTPEVSKERKIALLNSCLDSLEVFEKACLMDEAEWKVFSVLQAFIDAIRIPASIYVPSSARVLGSAIISSTELIGTALYKAVMRSVAEEGTINPEIFNSINSSPSYKVTGDNVRPEQVVPQYSFNIPWGKIQMYSSLLNEMVDFPAYPEQVNTSRHATYTSMPDTIYQYEPWILYENSGPREQELSFHLHRDMWTGNHLDGQANKLIRFCEANTFPRYSGSAVLTPTVRLYIDGKLFISGVLTATSTNWSGPLGHDNWYLEFNLSLTIQEVSDKPLNIDSVYSTGLIG